MPDEEMDFLTEIIAEGTALDPAFPEMVAAAEQQRLLERAAVARRARLGLDAEGRSGEIPTTSHLDVNRLIPRSRRHEQYSAHRLRRKG